MSSTLRDCHRIRSTGLENTKKKKNIYPARSSQNFPSCRTKGNSLGIIFNRYEEFRVRNTGRDFFFLFLYVDWVLKMYNFVHEGLLACRALFSMISLLLLKKKKIYEVSREMRTMNFHSRLLTSDSLSATDFFTTIHRFLHIKANVCWM